MWETLLSTSVTHEPRHDSSHMTEPVMTGHNRSWISPKISRNVRDRGPDCSCSLLRSWEFAVLSVQVRSSPGLFPVLRPDFQTLVTLDYGQKQNSIVWFISPPRSQWVPQCLNTGLESSSCLSVALEQLNEHVRFSWTDQTIETDPRLELWLWLVLSFCELGNFRTARSEQHPIIALSLFNVSSKLLAPTLS